MKHKIEYVDVDALQSAPRNAKDHDDELIGASFERFGFGESALLDERTGLLVAGHGRRDRLRQMRADGAAVPDGIEARKDGRWFMPVERGWASKDDDDALAAGIAFNSIGERGGWKSEDLWTDLSTLQASDGGLDALGFTLADLDALSAQHDPDHVPAHWKKEGLDDEGALLALADLTVAEPAHQVARGSAWEMSGRHVLIVADVMLAHGQWSPYLEPDVIFCPFPGPYLAIADAARDRPLLLVQPDPYLAGHILDKYAALFGDDSIVELEPVDVKPLPIDTDA